MEILNAETIKKHPRLFTKISKHNDVIMLRNTNERNVSSSVYNFKINTNLCKMITVDSIVTYTFYVIREQDNGFFENLVLREKPDGTYIAKLLQYNITEAEKQLMLNGVDVDLNNKISSTVINDSDFISDVTNRIYYSPTGQCYDVTSVYVPGNMCASGEHAYGNPACDYLQPSSGQYNPAKQATAGTTQLVYTEMDCGGGGGGPSGPSDGGGSGGSGPTSPTGPGLPTFEVEDEDGPCSKLKQVSLAMKERLDDIDDAASASNCETCEFGYQMENNSSNPNNPQIVNGPLIISNKNSVTTNYTTTSVGLIHSHSEGLNQMFSFSDVFNLYQLLQKTQQSNWSLGVVYLVSPFGITYAIKTNDIATFNFKIGQMIENTKGKNTMQKVNTLNDKLAQKHPSPSPFGPSINEREKMEEDFLLFFANAGLSIYSTTDSNYQNWNKLTLSNKSWFFFSIF